MLDSLMTKEINSLQLDYEKYQGRVDTARKKTKRTEKDNVSLEKSEVLLEHAKEVRHHHKHGYNKTSVRSVPIH